MPKKEIDAFIRMFCANTKAARLRTGKRQKDVAEILDIETSTYKKYENTVCMPHRLIPRFTNLCDIEIADLFTGMNHDDIAPAQQAIRVKAANR